MVAVTQSPVREDLCGLRVSVVKLAQNKGNHTEHKPVQTKKFYEPHLRYSLTVAVG
jgi:hypothetical protein